MISNVSGGARAAVALSLLLSSVAPVTAQAPGLSNAYLVGTWKEDRSCGGANAMSFDASGVAIVQGSRLNYSVTGTETITLSGTSGSLVIRSQVVDQNTMLADFGGSRNALYRCSGSYAHSPTTAVPSFTPTPNFIVGKWTDSGNCGDTFTFAGNGDWLNNNGIKVGDWLLNGSTLIITLANGTVSYNLSATDANSMTGTENVPSGFGKTSFMKRCP